jgi:hypothetical protein
VSEKIKLYKNSTEIVKIYIDRESVFEFNFLLLFFALMEEVVIELIDLHMIVGREKNPIN